MNKLWWLACVVWTIGCGELKTASPDADADASDAASVSQDAAMDLAWVDDRDAQADGPTAPDAATDAQDASPDVAVENPTPMSAGCVDGTGIPEGENTFMLNARQRRYMMRLPQNYDPKHPWPLVFALHGNGGSVAYWDGTSGDRNMRDVLKNDAVYVVAEAIDGQWRDYNADAATWPARMEEELQYFDRIIEDAKANLCIREDAIFSMGFSGGGSFSGVLGCRRTDIRAIAVGGSVIYFDEADCVGTPAAWITIGTQELVSGREAFRDYFRDRAGCETASTATSPSPCVAFDNCDEGTPVTYCQHPDGHIWPAFGSQASWNFFTQFVTP